MTGEDLIAKMEAGEVTNKTEMCNKKVTNMKYMLGGWGEQMTTSCKEQFLKGLCGN